MIIGISLMIMLVITVFSIILGRNFIAGFATIAIDNDALIDGDSTTFEVLEQEILFIIDTSDLIISAIAMLVALGAAAAIAGINVLGSGISAQNAKIIVILIGYGTLWTVLSIISFNFIIEIEIFGSIIYITLTLVYVIGVFQNLN